MKQQLVIGALAALGLMQAAWAAPPDKSDHPLVTPYEGSVVYSKDVKEFDEYRVFKGWNTETRQFDTETLEGKVTRILYKNPPQRSVLELYRNYRAALQKEGAEILWECNQANMECVNGYVGANLRQQFGIAALGNKAGHYLFARVEQASQTAYLALAVGEANTDVHVVEMKKMQTGKASLNPGALLEGLDKQGFAVLEGIYFDTDKTTLKSTSKPALEQAAKLMQEQPGLTLYVVGHTDMLGSLEHNMTLSQGRADAVVSALVKDYGIAAGRVEGRGVGPLAPVAANTQDDGRARNRRVVLVRRTQ